MSDLVSVDQPTRFPAHLVDYAKAHPVARNESLKSIRRRCRDLISQGTPYAAMRLMEAANGNDDRVAVIAASQLLDHARKIDDGTPEGGPMDLDTSRFSEEQRADCIEAARRLAHYIALSRRLAAEDGVVIEGTVG